MRRTLRKPELKDQYKKEGTVKCPKCGNAELVRPDWTFDAIIQQCKEPSCIVVCPRCEEGELIPKEIATY